MLVSVAGRKSQVAGFKSQVASFKSQVAGRRSQVAGLQVRFDISRVCWCGRCRRSHPFDNQGDVSFDPIDPFEAHGYDQ